MTIGWPEAAVDGEVQLVAAALPNKHQALLLKLEDGLWAQRSSSDSTCRSSSSAVGSLLTCGTVVGLPHWRWESFPRLTARRPPRAFCANIVREMATGALGGARPPFWLSHRRQSRGGSSATTFLGGPLLP